jgi:hypothetical protein
MNQYLEDAFEELKRVDHLIYVSLKYTRTVDIIKSIIERLINSYDFAIMGLLMMLKDKNVIQDVPKSPGLRASMIRDHYKDEPIILDFIQFYHLLRDISRAEYRRSSEYRRHVKMTALVDSGTVEIDIDIINEYYRKTRIFIDMTNQIVASGEAGKELAKFDFAKMKESVITEMDFNKR